MDIFKVFCVEGLIDWFGVGGNFILEFMLYIVKENFDVVFGFLYLDVCNLIVLDEYILYF